METDPPRHVPPDPGPDDMEKGEQVDETRHVPPKPPANPAPEPDDDD